MLRQIQWRNRSHTGSCETPYRYQCNSAANGSRPNRARFARAADSPQVLPGLELETLLRMSWASHEGLPYPLGVSWCADDHAYNFALYSKHATEVRLLLFSAADASSPEVEIAFDPLTNKSG